MFKKYFTFSIILFFWIKCDCARIQFARCGLAGFSCITNEKTKTQALTYQCVAGVDDPIIYINQFSSPPNIESLAIKNCHKLTISVRCTGERKNIKSLEISNVENLVIQRLPFSSTLPPKVILENISYVEVIPSYTFSQIDRTQLTSGCYIPTNDFKSISLVNVTIGTIQSNAFVMPNNMGNISFKDVKVNRLQSSSILGNLDKFSLFSVEKTTVNVTEHLAFQLIAKKAIFRESKFNEIASSGINGTIETLYFANNSVHSLQPRAISILSTNVFLLNNRFEYLKSGALENISPGLMEDSMKNFGTLRFRYEFNGNNINFMDAGCLHPDILAYDNVASEITFERNSLFCSCENIGWLFSKLGHGYNTATIEGFYEKILDESNENNCSYSCDLPITAMHRIIENDKCMQNITLDWLCNNMNEIPRSNSELLAVSYFLLLIIFGIFNF